MAISLAQASRITLIAVALGFSCARAANSAPPPSSAVPIYPFGMNSNTNFVIRPDYPSALLDTGADMVRIGADFRTVRPTDEANPDEWNWKSLDQVRALRERYPKLKFLIILGYGADWAADPAYDKVKSGGLSAPQRGIDVRPVDDPQNLYGQYVYEVVRRYHDVVDAWESWNEPDLPGHHYFKGSGAEFMPYQRTFYLSAKKADPHCTALFAAMTFANPEGYLHAHHLNAPSPNQIGASFFEQYLQALAKDPQAKAHNDYFDVMNQHSYSRASDLYDYTMIDQKVMRDYLGTQKPVWITEMGTTDRGGPFGTTPDGYCDYILQSYAWGSLAGVQKYFHFQLDNSNGHGLYTGMLGKAKPALTTYRDVLVKLFADAHLVKQLHGNAGVGFLDGNSPYKGTWRKGYDLFEFRANGGRRLIYMAFTDSTDAADITIPAQAKVATVIDRHNDRHQLDAVDGVFRLHLDEATNEAGWPTMKNVPAASALGLPEHLVGGAATVLVEDVP